MANTPITDPSAILYCDTVIRPAADRLIQLYNWAKNAQAQFTAKSLSTLIPNDATDIVHDSAFAGDGRTVINGFDVNVVLSYLGSFITAMEASSNTEYNQVGKVAVNTY